ncbi:phage tail family protein [Metabacillus indicus]|uniref:phage tail domain-containing protein n=1 Tax=Metabacillus indicus TaxID=246786 RepID=UPI002A027913|nr:phage tail domain-containing protein [Metabacillus indicus]MDX8288831.1 phage tail family protein [Metabacillus indicus]
MFQIYSEDFNPVSLPVDDMGYGLKGMDVEISSTAVDVTEHSIAGVPGRTITGFNDAEREISLNARLKVKDAIDYRLKRDRIFAFFKRIGAFYVTENQQSNKLMKVRVVESYRFERPDNMRTFATVTIPLKIIGQPYWISRFKTMNLNNVGVPMNGNWSFGMGLDVDPGKLKYSHSNQSSFNIFNAGTVPLKTIQEVDNCLITIDVMQAVANFKITDATGRYFEYNPLKKSNWALTSGSKILLSGHYMSLNNTPILERTNRYFFNLLPGDNTFAVEGLSTYTINFDFRFKYD